MSTYSLDTPEGRAEARKMHEKEISLLKADKQIEVKALQELTNANSSNLNRRDTLYRKLGSRKSFSKLFLIIGAIVLGIGLLNISNPDHKNIAVLMTIGGAALAVLGIFFFVASKKFYPELNELNDALTAFDEAAYKLNSKICEYDNKIAKHCSALDEIADREKYARFYQWADTVATNHVFLYVTGEIKVMADKPQPPKAKKYGYAPVKDARIYIDDMSYAHVDLNYNRSIGVARLDDPGTHKLEIYAQYEIGGRLKYDWVSEAKPIKPSNQSIFVWLHVSTCGKGTQCYCSSYGNMNAFLNSTGISKDEMMQLFM